MLYDCSVDVLLQRAVYALRVVAMSVLQKATPEEFVKEAVRWAIVKGDMGANLYGITRLATMDEVLQDVASVLKLDVRALIAYEVAPPNCPEIDTEPLMVLQYLSLIHI